LVDPGAIAQPINETMAGPTRNAFLAWNVSERDAMRGARTAWTSDKELGTQVPAAVLLRSFSI
jgi:hypothetical protein